MKEDIICQYFTENALISRMDFMVFAKHVETREIYIRQLRFPLQLLKVKKIRVEKLI